MRLRKKLIRLCTVSTIFSIGNFSTLSTQAISPTTITIIHNTGREAPAFWLTHPSCSKRYTVTQPQSNWKTKYQISQFSSCKGVQLTDRTEFDIGKAVFPMIVIPGKKSFKGHLVTPGKSYRLSDLIDHATKITIADLE